MKTKTIQLDSPLYPLPADYRSLTADGKRMARVNACRQWLIPTETPDLKAHRFVEGIRFFDHWYLHPNQEIGWDPLFYDMDPLPVPEIHWRLCRKWAVTSQNVDVMPRGAAKSTLMRKCGLFRMVSHPNYSQVYATSTHDNAKHTGQLVRDQVHNNERIREDWDAEYGVEMKPPRGSAPTGVEYFYAGNGSSFRCVSAATRLRGIRPRRFLLDDPEFDETASTSMVTIRDYMERLLFKIVLPTVMRPNCGVDWVGTFVTKRHYLWHAMDVYRDGEGDSHAKDPRFEFFNRNITRMVEPVEGGGYVSCWPHMWPKDDEERERLGVAKDTYTLREVEQRVGPAVWQSEYMANPGTGSAYFTIDTEPKGKHAWWLGQPDRAYLDGEPYQSTALIRWNGAEALEEMPLGEFLRRHKHFMTVDTSWTANAHSDRKGFAHLAVTPSNELFVLGMWSAQCSETRLVNEAFTYADKWKVPVIYVEVVKQSFGLHQRMLSMALTKATEEMGLRHTPYVKDLRPGQTAKESKIAALDTRMEHGLLKLPLFTAGKNAAIRRLVEQFQGFNPEAADGGLQHDDEIDMVAMSMFILKGRLRKYLEQKPEDEDTVDAVDLLRRGETHHQGVPVALGINLASQSVNLGDLMHAIAQTQRKPKHGTLA